MSKVHQAEVHERHIKANQNASNTGTAWLLDSSDTMQSQF